MNLQAARVALRPRALVDVLDLAVPFCVRSWRGLAGLGAVVLLPATAGCLYLAWGEGMAWPQVWLLAVLAADCLAGVFTMAAGELMFREPREVRPGPTLWSFLRRAGAYLVGYLASRVVFLVALGSVVGLLLVVPRFLFVREAVLLERSGPLAALGRSVRLARRHVGSCMALAMALALIPALFVIGVELLGQAVLRFTLQMGTPLGDLFETGGSAFAVLGLYLSVPVTAAARFLKYIDLRTRKEGWDLQLRFMALAGGGGGGAGGAGTREGARAEGAERRAS